MIEIDFDIPLTNRQKEILKKYKKNLNDIKKIENSRPDSSKFTYLKLDREIRNIKLEYSFCNNKLVKLDTETLKIKKIIDYIVSRFEGKSYVMERNSCIFYNDKNQIVYDFAVKNKSVSGFEILDRNIFSHPLIAFAITNSDKTREMYLNSIELSDTEMGYYFLIDLKSKIIMLYKNESRYYNEIFDTKIKIIKPNFGKFEVLNIEFDSKKFFY
jgi:hypothetical protein